MRELRAAQAGDEVAAANAPRLLERAQNGIERGEAAGNALGQDAGARENAVA